MTARVGPGRLAVDPDAASHPVPLHPDAYVSRCGRCGAWTWMDDPCGVCLDAALRDYRT